MPDLLLATPPDPTQWYVRVNGDDARCTGLVDLDVDPNGPLMDQPCAFKTVNRAFLGNSSLGFPWQNGDDVQLGPGTHDAFQLPQIMASQSNPTVIAGNPGLSRTEVIVNSNGFGAREAILSNLPANSTPSKFVTIRHLSFKVGTIYGINLNGPHQDVLLTDLEVSPSGFGSSFCCADTAMLPLDPNSPLSSTNLIDGTSRAAAIRAWGPGQRSRITVLDARLIAPGSGPATITSDDITGVNGNAVAINADESRVKGVEAGHFMGSFVHEIAANSYVEENLVTDTVCAGGEGCLYSYNDENIVIRRNIMDRIRPGGNQTAIKIRRTTTTSPDATIIVYNNTLIGKPGQLSAPEVGMEWAENAGAVPTQGAVFVNNLVMHLGKAGNSFGTPDSYAVELGHCPAQSAQFQISNNQYWANAVGFHRPVSLNFKNDDGTQAWPNPPNPLCASVADLSSVETNPQLDTLYRPPLLNHACTGGTTGYVAPDGDHSSLHIGAKPCGGGGGNGDPGCGSGRLCDQEQ